MIAKLDNCFESESIKVCKVRCEMSYRAFEHLEKPFGCWKSYQDVANSRRNFGYSILDDLQKGLLKGKCLG